MEFDTIIKNERITLYTRFLTSTIIGSIEIRIDDNRYEGPSFIKYPDMTVIWKLFWKIKYEK